MDSFRRSNFEIVSWDSGS